MAPGDVRVCIERLWTAEVGTAVLKGYVVCHAEGSGSAAARS